MCFTLLLRINDVCYDTEVIMMPSLEICPALPGKLKSA